MPLGAGAPSTPTVTTVLGAVVVAVLMTVLVGAGTELAGGGASSGAGFSHTDCDPGAPMLGKRLSRIP